MTIGIYKLVFSSTDLVYVGKSLDILSREKEHRRKLLSGAHSNRLLRAQYVSTGELPQLELLEEVQLTDTANLDDTLNLKEIYWIERLNAYTNGFNHTTGGDVISGEGSQASKYTDAQYYNVLNLLATTDLIYTEISRITRVHLNTINNMVAEKSQIALRSLYPELYRLMLLKKHKRKSKYPEEVYHNILYDLINTKYSQAEISRKHSVEHSTVSHVLTKGHYGFLDKDLVAIAIELRPKTKRVDTTNIKLVSPTGEIHYILSTQKEFASLHGLGISSLSQLLSGKLRHHKGWKAYVEPV